MSKKLIVVEPLLCTGCQQCELACSITRTGVANQANARIRVTKTEDRRRCQPVVCRQCSPAPCAEACPTEALGRDAVTGAVVINYDLCINCGQCLTACPFGAMQLSTDGQVIKCDLCGGDPACVKYCQARPENSSAFMANPRASALQFVEPVDATLTRRVIQARKSEQAGA